MDLWWKQEVIDGSLRGHEDRGRGQTYTHTHTHRYALVSEYTCTLTHLKKLCDTFSSPTHTGTIMQTHLLLIMRVA